MKKLLLIIGVVLLFGSATFSQFSFYLIDNFESGNINTGTKWWGFGALNIKVVENKATANRDLIAESCGDYALRLVGATNNWYIGGLGTDLGVSADRYSRFQIDICGGGKYQGKLVVELFDDDNQNYSIEQDPAKNYETVYDDKWVVELNVLGQGYTRMSVPFSAFRDANPGIGDDIWNPEQKDGSGGLLKLQLVAISQEQAGKVDFKIDNILLTY
ncbi:hypothetical protein ACFL5U_03775 [Candidatus Margulisiibacteriota bacterium]